MLCVCVKVCISPPVPSPWVMVSPSTESELMSGSSLSLTCSIQPHGKSSVDTATTVTSSGMLLTAFMTESTQPMSPVWSWSYPVCRHLTVETTSVQPVGLTPVTVCMLYTVTQPMICSTLLSVSYLQEYGNERVYRRHMLHS